MASRVPVPYRGGGGGGGRGERPPIPLQMQKINNPTYIYGNLVAVSPMDFPPNRDGSDLYLRLWTESTDVVVNCRPLDNFPPGCIYLSDPQRNWARIGLTDRLQGQIYDPFTAQGSQVYLQSMNVEIGFASPKKQTETPYKADTLEQRFIKMFNNQIFAPGQVILMDYENIPLYVTIKTVQLMDLGSAQSEKPPADAGGPMQSAHTSRGILVPQTRINFTKSPTNPVKLVGSATRPVQNSIISSDFDFKSLGIGGVDKEFMTLFRRAFASRLVPPGLFVKLGIRHCKGILLYGPPGTGKTLIARKIAKMLNSREPIIVNGPELLNKYVGASEENVRKLFLEAEKEHKAKGEDSELHIIIFDELDAVCRQRGSGGSGGSNVGDNIVNQLLTKLDGVEELPNVLLIGMTNRKDLIDTALLRAGRLELHIEINLPDEAGREQIFTIHTAKMRENDTLANDVNTKELASLSKNFSGAEIAGLVNAATSYAFNRHTKVGSIATINDSISELKVCREDFLSALSEVKPAHGVSEESLQEAMPLGIIHYGEVVESVIRKAMSCVNNVKVVEEKQVHSILMHGPRGSGKTALAAHIALQSQSPFMKIISSRALSGMASEASKKDHIINIFTEAYRSPLSLIIIDSIERIIEYNQVGPRWSQTLLSLIIDLANAPPPKGRKIVVICTTSRRSALVEFGEIGEFKTEIAVPAVSSVQELAAVLQEMQVFGPGLQEVLGKIHAVANGRFGVGIRAVVEQARYAQVQSQKGMNPAAVMDDFVDNITDEMARSGIF